MIVGRSSQRDERNQMNARQRYTELVRQFLSGRMTNLKYELACDLLMRDLDEASDKVYCELWYSYCDVREHRMGKKTRHDSRRPENCRTMDHVLEEQQAIRIPPHDLPERLDCLSYAWGCTQVRIPTKHRRRSRLLAVLS